MNSKDKAFIGKKIIENNGIIKTNLNDVDYIIVSEGVFKGEEKDMREEQIKIFNYINLTHKDNGDLSLNSCLNKNIAFIHESNYKSRIAKLVTHVPKKQAENNKEVRVPEPGHIKFSNVFDFL